MIFVNAVGEVTLCGELPPLITTAMPETLVESAVVGAGGAPRWRTACTAPDWSVTLEMKFSMLKLLLGRSWASHAARVPIRASRLQVRRAFGRRIAMVIVLGLGLGPRYRPD